MIQFKNVTLSFGEHHALKRVNFQLPKGSFTLLEGHSGAGKSSILRLLATFEQPTSGDILIGRSSIARLSRRERAHYRRSVGYTGGDVDLLENRNCFDNVALPLRIAGLSEDDVQSRVKAALARVGLSHTDRMLPSELSGGQQLRLQIARAVVNRPSLVLADEPTAQLDDESAARVVGLLEEFNHAGVTVIVATHEAARFNRVTHRLRLAEGEVLPTLTEDGTRAEPGVQAFSQEFINKAYGA
ncbi:MULTISPECIES: cell division ATP-binding protein FtsE [Limnobacter]|uniref:Cell division ATP-binding protein FtsE n=2 Tax=Limnobacter TaxID=131079 RepID=A0ABQ5YVB1_9BURK|nr:MULTISPECIES: ATP-binding cassette domain-containing protein [Limnobacter]GLR27412.1 cell division ATP-binding protein FtsE [Limnobacter litoralis]HEX5486770.1 ATP-binding cassette domain-containing protein [Limnobacter sp.]